MKRPFIYLIILVITTFPICFLCRYHIYDIANSAYRTIFIDKPIISRLNNNLLETKLPEINTNSIINTHTINLFIDEKTSLSKKKVMINSDIGLFTQIDKYKQGIDNTIYVINNHFNLDGKTVSLPYGCVLEIKGSISNGTLIGDESSIIADNEEIFRNVDIAGTWNIEKIFSSWFNDICELNGLKKIINLTSDSVWNEVVVNQGNYLLAAHNNGDEILHLKSYTRIQLDGIISLQPNAFEDFQVFRIESKIGVSICGSGKILGERWEHGSLKGEGGHAIVIRRSTDIYIHGITINNFWGDGIGIGGLIGDPCENIIIDSCIIQNSRRNGVSIVHAKGFRVSNSSFYNNEGTSPERAIDIEPNKDCFCIDGIIENNYIEGKYGICTALEGEGNNFINNIIIRGNTLICHTGNYVANYGRAISLLGNPINIMVEHNIIKNGGIYACSSDLNRKLVIRNNDIKGKCRIDNIECVNNNIDCIAIQCDNSIFKDNVVIANASDGTGNGETAIVANTSVVKNNSFYITGDKYSFDCVITSRRNSEIENNTIDVSKNSSVRYLVRVLSGTKTIIQNNKAPQNLKVLDYGIGTIVNQ